MYHPMAKSLFFGLIISSKRVISYIGVDDKLVSLSSNDRDGPWDFENGLGWDLYQIHDGWLMMSLVIFF